MLALQRVARSASELEWDEWWLKSVVRHIKPWWRRMFIPVPRLPGWPTGRVRL